MQLEVRSGMPLFKLPRFNNKGTQLRQPREDDDGGPQVTASEAAHWQAIRTGSHSSLSVALLKFPPSPTHP
jgi:hypothetical protein